MTRRSTGLPVHAGSVNRRSFAAGATAESPPATRASSAARLEARPATRPGRLASAAANRSAERPGKNRRSGPRAAWVRSRSRAAAVSGAPGEAESAVLSLMTAPPSLTARPRGS